MKRFSLLLLLLLSVTFGAVAQQVAKDATSIDTLTSGYYVIRVKSNDGKATASYLYAKDSKVYYDAKGSEKALAGSEIDGNTSSYMFYITKNSDGTIAISLWNNHNTAWPKIGNASLVGGNGQTPGRQDQFTMGSSAAAFTATATSDGYILSLDSHYYYWSNKSCTGFVVLNDNQHVGYYDWQKSTYNDESTIAKVQFYAVSGTPLATPINITYNLKHDGNTIYTESHSIAFADVEFPEIAAAKTYYWAGEKPSGNVTTADADKSYDIEVSQAELPFKTDTYYYLGTAGDSPVMISHKSGNDVAYRSKAQADTYNDILKDLWYVTGNVFDGFCFTNASSAHDIKSSNCIAGNTVTELAADAAELSFSGNAAYTEYWDIRQGSNGGFMVYPHSNEGKNRYWSYNGSIVKFNNNSGDVKDFAVYEPEFDFPMYTVGDASYNSIALPFAAQLAEGETAKMYKGKVNENVLEVTEVSALPASAGVVLIGEANAGTAKFVAVMNAEEITDNDLIGTTVQIANADLSDKLIFGTSKEEGDVGFFSASSTAVLNANHAYLNKTEATVKGLAIHFNGEPTGIVLPTDNAPAAANAPVYDLSGRRVASTVKGHLYIQNGRKFIAE